MSFEIQASADTSSDSQNESDPNGHAARVRENVVEGLVEHSRANQVLNEQQTIVLTLTYLTGWFDDPERYDAALVSGGSSSGKTHMKQRVVDTLFEQCPPETLYTTTSASGLAMQDDEAWDECRVAALNEMNQLEQETIEFLKASTGEDGGSTRTRNVQDSDAEGGFSPETIAREPKPYVMLFADENPAAMEWELATRMMTIRVDSTVAKNRAVGKSQWGHEEVELDDGGGDRYMFETDVTTRLQEHIAGLPTDVAVELPDGTGDHAWSMWNVVAPIFKWKDDDSTRASRMISNLVRASALLNHENRESHDRVEDGFADSQGASAQSRHVSRGDEPDSEDHVTTYVAEPQDLANVLACRRTLLTTTHDMSPIKFAVTEAIESEGHQANTEGTARAASVDTIQSYLNETWGGSSVTKTQLEDLLDEMVEHYILGREELPEEVVYIYSGGEKLGHPNIGEYPDRFAATTDPIRGQPLPETIAEQRDAFGADTGGSRVTDVQSQDRVEDGPNADSSGQQRLVSTEDREPLSDVAEHVHTRLVDTLETLAFESEVVDDVEYEHMIGVTPLHRYTEDGIQLAAPERPPTTEDRDGTIFDPHSHWWDGMEVDETDVRDRIRAAVEECIDRGLVRFEDDGEITDVHTEPQA